MTGQPDELTQRASLHSALFRRARAAWSQIERACRGPERAPVMATLTFDSNFPGPGTTDSMRPDVVASSAQPTRHFVFSSPASDIAVSVYSSGVGAERRWSIAGQVYADQDQEFTVVVGFDHVTETVVTDPAGTFDVVDLEIGQVQLSVLGHGGPIELGRLGPDGAVEPS